MNVGVVIPACNEEATVGALVEQVWSAAEGRWPLRVVVADNGSTDATSRLAREAGAEVVAVPKRGYGRACLAAVRRLGEWPQALLFLDADGSSLPREMGLLLEPIEAGEAELVLGARPPDSPMTPPQRWGTRLATRLIARRWGRRFQDMGPFRAVSLHAYRSLGMQDTTWGWTVEMQILALKRGLAIREVAVSWVRRQGGVSKISGTVTGVLRAGARILWTIAREAI